MFKVTVYVGDRAVSIGVGVTLQDAEENAAIFLPECEHGKLYSYECEEVAS